MRPSIIVDRWGIKTSSLLGYAVTMDDFYVSREFAYSRGGTTPGTLVNASGDVVDAVLNTPRIDYRDGSPALLVEPAATNFIPNSSMAGTYVSGVPPFFSVSGGLTTTISPAGTVGGINYIDLTVSGTGSGFYNLRFNAGNSAIGPTTIGQQYTGSVYIALISGVSPTGNLMQIQETTSTGSSGGSGGFTNFVTSITPQLTRYSATHTVTQAAGLTHINMRWGHAIASGVEYNYTVRIGLPQLELGTVATSPIRTTTTALTRNADACSLSNASSLIGQTEGTIYAEFNMQTFGVEGYAIRLVAASFDNSVLIVRSSANLVSLIVRAGGSNVFSQAVAATGFVKAAVAYKSGDIAAFVNGTQVGTTSTSSLTFGASFTAVNLGAFSSSLAFINDRIRAAKIFKERLGASDLANLTKL